MRLSAVLTVIAISAATRASDYNDTEDDRSEDLWRYGGSGNSRTSGGYKNSWSPVLSTPEQCARTCRRREPPRTCYYHFTVEYSVILSGACNLCRSNKTVRLIDDCQCIEADGFQKSGVITANRMFPGPAIVVCEDDNVVIDLENHLVGSAITIHWHGLWQKGSQIADGIPYVTQCPIVEGTTYRYQFKAANAGTHFWHAHTGLHKGEGLEGSLIVRQPKSVEVNSDTWDYEDMQHVIFLSDWSHKAASESFPGFGNPDDWSDNFLINGKGRWTNPEFGNTTTTPLAVFTVTPGLRHRFRLINACSMVCPLQFTIQGHDLTLIASDGEPLVPVTVTTINSFAAERYDFVVNADQPVGSYWIQARGVGLCNSRKLQQLAILRYESASDEPELEMPTFDAGLKLGVVFNELNVHCDGESNPPDVVCMSQMKNANPVPERILRGEPDVRLYMDFGFYNFVAPDPFVPGKYQRYLYAGEDAVSHMGNITHIFPPSPLMTQPWDVPRDLLCTPTNLPAKCKGPGPCACSHVEKIPLNALVEIILVDETQFVDLSHPFHLHGYVFYLVAEGTGDYYNVSRMDVASAKRLDKAGRIRRDLVSPPAKDTFAVPNNGFSIIRFIADNPGYWLLHCHFEFHMEVGMVAVFHVGEHSDLPPVPRGYPRCGDYVPPIGNNYYYYN